MVASDVEESPDVRERVPCPPVPEFHSRIGKLVSA
jgi:hypothetical protein